MRHPPPWYKPPLHVQVADELRERIRSGELAPGAPLPSETTMHQEYGVSRPTVRRVVAQLRSESLVVTVQGSGTFVRPQPRYRHRIMLPADAALSTRMATPEESARYGLGEGIPMLVIERTGRRTVVLPGDRIVVLGRIR